MQKKLHILPVSSNYIRSQNQTIEYTDHHHFIQFDSNTISFKPLSMVSMQNPGNIDLIISKFQAILRIYNGKHFQKLKLCFWEWAELDTKALSRIGSEIGKHFRNIKELQVNFFSCPRVTEKGLQHLLNPISRCIKGLRTFEILLSGSSLINKNGADHIKSLILNRVNNLSKISLNVAGESANPQQGYFLHETDVLTRLENQRMALVGPNMYYVQNEMYAKAALSLFNRTKYCLLTLQQLVLTFPNASRIMETINTISTVFQNAENLQVLYLGFIDNYLFGYDHNKVNQINYYLKKNLTRLRHLTLKFNTYCQSEDWRQKLRRMVSNTLYNLPKLRGFTLSFENAEKMTDENLLEIVNDICLHAKLLESLTLDFETARQIRNQAISQTKHEVGQHLVSLKEFILNFRYTEKFEEDEVQIIPNEGFPSITRLHLYLPHNSFSFDFSGMHQRLEVLTLAFGQLVDMSSGKVGELLAPLFNFEFKNLQRLTLKLGQAQQIVDEDLRMLCSFNWNCFPNLKGLTFGISDYYEITDAGLKHISGLIITHLRGLFIFKLIFDGGFASITEDGIKKLALTVAKNMKQLENLELNFGSTKMSQETADSIVTQIAENMKKLKRIRVEFCPENQREDIDFICKMRRKFYFVPTVDFFFNSKKEDF